MFKVKSRAKFKGSYSNGFQPSDDSEIEDEEYIQTGSEQNFQVKINSVKKMIATPEKFNFEFD